MRCSIVGGGPAGLYLALLLKQRNPGFEVDVYEQNAADATYGFGIVLADRGLKHLRRAHPESCAAIERASFVSRHRIVTHRGQSIFIEENAYGASISRLRLLEILQRFCRDAGVALNFRQRVEGPDQFGEADLLVGADGANSVIRDSLCDAFGTMRSKVGSWLSWCGTEQHFPYPILSFRKTDAGVFFAAGYAYTERFSTFVPECTQRTWVSAGFDRMTDEQRNAAAAEIFAEELEGRPLVSNNSIWRQLPVIRNRNWYSGHAVLIGDALHSAHPSIGSGTRIGMEDSIALADAIQANSSPSGVDVPAALAEFEARRSVTRHKLNEAMDLSIAWYADVERKMAEYEPVPFVFDFLMRTGRITEDRLRDYFPRFMAQYSADWASYVHGSRPR